MIDLRLLINKGVHFGHQGSRRNPKMRPYVWGRKNGIDIIDVTKTASQLEKASAFLKQITSEGKEVLWCGTKKAAVAVIEQAGTQTSCPVAAHRWIGGTLTNWAQIKKAITKLLHLEDVLAKGGQQYTKKELGVFTKQVERGRRNVGGLRDFTWPLGALVVVDVRKEYVAVSEALDRGIPVVAIVDTNGDPSGITYPIPANDDAPQAVACIIEYLSQAVQEGKALARERAAEKAREAAAKGAAEAAAMTVPVLDEEKSVLQAQLEAVEAALGGEEAEKAGGAARKAPAARPTRRPAGSGDRRTAGPRKPKVTKE